MYTSGKEGFIGIHVAYASEEALIAEHSLDRCRALFRPFP
jgi:hypothetical protein